MCWCLNHTGWAPHFVYSCCLVTGGGAVSQQSSVTVTQKSWTKVNLWMSPFQTMTVCCEQLRHLHFKVQVVQEQHCEVCDKVVDLVIDSMPSLAILQWKEIGLNVAPGPLFFR